MKKHKSKSKNSSASKKTRKELESKLTTAFNEVLTQFGKAKKTEKVIEKFTKQLAKKVSFKPLNDAIEPFIKEDEAPVITLKEKITRPDAAKKVKVPVTEALETK